VPIAITNLQRSVAGLTLTISGPPGQAVVIERSSDFQNWNVVSSIFIPDRSVEFTDGAPQSGHYFYRLRVE
jgi:beta-xylosidase